MANSLSLRPFFLANFEVPRRVLAFGLSVGATWGLDAIVFVNIKAGE